MQDNEGMNQRVQMEVDDPRRFSVHLAPIPQPPTKDNIVASQKSIFEDQNKTIDYIMSEILNRAQKLAPKYLEVFQDRQRQIQAQITQKLEDKKVKREKTGGTKLNSLKFFWQCGIIYVL